jgi:Tfp pilus assembly protein PilV
MMRRSRIRSIRRRSGISLIEVVVACTLLAVTLTALTGLSARMAARTRNVGLVEQRTATYFQEVNRVESMSYDSLSTGRFLVTDSVKAGNIWYVWSYAVGAQTFNSNPTSTSSYRDITLTVTPRSTGATAVTGVIRRAKPAAVNAFNLP